MTNNSVLHILVLIYSVTVILTNATKRQKFLENW